MKITFLGTGPSGRIPRPNCKWYVCKEAKKPGSKSARLQSSAFFSAIGGSASGGEFSDFNVLIDVSLDIKKQLKLIKNKNISAIFLTHGHIDAAGGLKQLYKLNKKSDLPTVYTEKNTKNVLAKDFLWTDFPRVKDSLWASFPFKEIEPLKKIIFSNFAVIPFRVEHAFNPKFLTLGYLFEIKGKRVVYASDFKIMPPESKKLIKNADLAILDCAAYNRPIPTHQSLPEILKLVKELNFKKVYLTQVGIAWPHYELAQKIVSKQSKNIFLAYDGLKLKF